MTKPNILLILADEHRQDCIGCYGNQDVKTPNIDFLAGEGTRYDEHYTVYPVCTPSRYSMLSGLYAHRHNAWTNASTLPAGFKTFPGLLRENGYKTAAVGKMHFTPTYQGVGFDTMILAEQNGRGRYEDDYHQYLADHGLIDQADITDQVDEYRKKAAADYYDCFGAAESDLECEHHSTSWITRQALDQINSWEETGGNLLMAGYIKPHHPFDPPAPYSRMYRPEALTILDGYTDAVPEKDYQRNPGFFDHKTLTEDRLRKIMAHYYGSITQIDDGVGEMISLLKQKGCYDHTMIIYTSDHGDYMGYHHMMLKGGHMYDPLMKLPLIIKYPEGGREAEVDSRLSENIDLPVTILSCCGIEPAPTMQGENIHRGKDGKKYVFAEAEYQLDGRQVCGYMVRSSKYKLLVNGSFDDRMFFDLERGPYELVNQIHNPIYKQMIREHQDDLIEKLLFRTPVTNHCDRAAPEIVESSLLESRYKRIRDMISQKFSH